MTKNITLGIVSVLIIALMGASIYFVVDNIELIKSYINGQVLYTQTDIDEAGQIGYDSAMADKQEYIDLIDEYKLMVNNLNDTLDTINVELTDITNSNNSNTATIELLNTQITTLNTQITALNTQISSLQATIAYYELLLANIDVENVAVVNFYIDSEIIDTQIITVGNSAADVEATKEQYSFIGWSIDGENVVDIEDYTIAEDTDFIAVFELDVYVTSISLSNEYTNTTGLSSGYVTDIETFDAGVANELELTISNLSSLISEYGMVIITLTVADISMEIIYSDDINCYSGSTNYTFIADNNTIYITLDNMTLGSCSAYVNYGQMFY